MLERGINFTKIKPSVLLRNENHTHLDEYDTYAAYNGIGTTAADYPKLLTSYWSVPYTSALPFAGWNRMLQQVPTFIIRNCSASIVLTSATLGLHAHFDAATIPLCDKSAAWLAESPLHAGATINYPVFPYPAISSGSHVVIYATPQCYVGDVVRIIETVPPFQTEDCLVESIAAGTSFTLYEVANDYSSNTTLTFLTTEEPNAVTMRPTLYGWPSLAAFTSLPADNLQLYITVTPNTGAVHDFWSIVLSAAPDQSRLLL